MRYAMMLGCLLALCGCIPPSIPVDVGGSKADGTIVMGTSVSSIGTVDWSGAAAVARERCRAWGYSRAEAFSGVMQQCTWMGAYGCNQYNVSRTYQCIE